MLAIILCLSKDQAGFEPMTTAPPVPALARFANPARRGWMPFFATFIHRVMHYHQRVSNALYTPCNMFSASNAGPYAAFLKGGLHGGVAQTGMLWALAHSPPRGVWGHAPPENFGNLDSLRVILRHSDSDL